LNLAFLAKSVKNPYFYLHRRALRASDCIRARPVAISGIGQVLCALERSLGALRKEYAFLVRDGKKLRERAVRLKMGVVMGKEIRENGKLRRKCGRLIKRHVAAIEWLGNARSDSAPVSAQQRD
jgi:hypothetical protein